MSNLKVPPLLNGTSTVVINLDSIFRSIQDKKQLVIRDRVGYG